MRALYLHSKYFYYKPIQPVENIPKDEGVEESLEFSDCLVVFLTIEKGDWDRREGIVNMLVNDVLEKMKSLRIKTLVLYPYAHLSDELEDPRRALRLLKILDRKFGQANIDFHRAPFGWYKEFKIHTYGHPLAESSRKF